MKTRDQVRIRAKSVLKLDTGQSNLDYEYSKEASIDAVAKNVLHAVIFNKGLTETKKFVEEFLDNYEPKWRDPE